MTGCVKTQRGAALIIVLLLVATLSFVLLSITNIVTAGVRRASAERARSELLWRAVAAERIAKNVIEQATAGSSVSMARESGLFAKPIELQMDDGAGSIVFADATACFNVNSLVAPGATGGGGYVANAASVDQFKLLLEQVGVGGGEAQKIADVIVDFIDTDPGTTGQGAEDNFYTLLPTPFRTADGFVASVSELRAMDGVTAEIYRRISPYLCARKDETPSTINVNMLHPDHAPMIYGLIAGAAGVGDIRERIAATPPTGWPSSPPPAPLDNASLHPQLHSDRIEARINLELGDHTLEERLLFEAVAGGEPKLLARTFGDDF